MKRRRAQRLCLLLGIAASGGVLLGTMIGCRLGQSYNVEGVEILSRGACLYWKTDGFSPESKCH